MHAVCTEEVRLYLHFSDLHTNKWDALDEHIHFRKSEIMH